MWVGGDKDGSAVLSLSHAESLWICVGFEIILLKGLGSNSTQTKLVHLVFGLFSALILVLTH